MSVLKSIEIENFRGIRKMEIPELNTINLFVGENGCGKTSVLEGVILNQETCDISAFRKHLLLLRSTFRDVTQNFNSGVGMLTTFPIFSRYDLLITPLFYSSKEKAEEIKITIQNTRGAKSLSLKETQSTISVSYREEDTLSYEFALDKNYEFALDKNSEGVKIKHELSEDKIGYKFFYQIGFANFLEQAADDYSFLEHSAREDILKFIKQLDARIDSLEIMSKNGMAVFNALLKAGNRIPINGLGYGIGFVLNLLSRMKAHSDRIFLLDEFESSIYYKHLPKLWPIFTELCEKHNNQIFAATHSFDTLQSLGEALEAKPDLPVTVHHLKKHDKEDTIDVFSYTGKEVTAAFDGGWDLR